jgi:hypothetical protein
MKLLKILMIVLLVQCVGFGLQAQSPDLINYQAVAYNSSGNSVANTAISIRISILQGSPTGTITYQETHNASTDANGAFDLQIGGGAVASGTFAGISWGSFSHYLRVEMDISGGSSYIIMGTSQMVSVPYAKYAETAGSVGGNAIRTGLHTQYFKHTASTVVPGSCTPLFAGYNLPLFVGTNNPNSISGHSSSYVVNFIINPATLAITSGVFINMNITSGSVSSDFNTITIIANDGAGCTHTSTHTRE